MLSPYSNVMGSDKGMKGTKKGYMDEPVSELETDHTSYCNNLLVLCVFGFLDPAVTLKPSLTTYQPVSLLFE